LITPFKLPDYDEAKPIFCAAMQQKPGRQAMRLYRQMSQLNEEAEL
jgi:hypothetical protein